MPTMIEYFEQSRKYIQEASTILCSDLYVQRKFQPVSFGTIGERFYCIVREKIDNLTEYRLLFNAAEYLSIDIQEKPSTINRITAEYLSIDIQEIVPPTNRTITNVTVHLTGSVAEALSVLLQYLIVESVGNKSNMLEGYFVKEAKNDVLFPVFERLDFWIVSSSASEKVVCKMLDCIKTPFDLALRQAFVWSMQGAEYDYFPLPDNEWGFIASLRGGRCNGAKLYYYELRSNSGTIRVEIRCKETEKQLMIFYPVIQTGQPALFKTLLDKIVFDCMHNCIAGQIRRIECFIENKPHELEVVQPAFNLYNAAPVKEGEDQVFEIIF